MKKSKKKKETTKKIIALIGVLFALSAITFLVYSVTSANEQIRNTEPETTAPPAPSEKAQTSQPSIVSLPPDDTEVIPGLVEYVEINSDTIGLIQVPNTTIDYPVVYSGDNEYYLTRDFDKVDSPYGAIFLDFRCDILDFAKTRNVILYGHRMKDGTMFKPLVNYEEESFFYENRIIRFDTLYESYEWEVFTVFETDTDFYYIDTDYPTDEKWLNFLEKCRSLSIFDTETTFSPTDIVLTLSTCASNNNERLVVMAKLKR